MRRLQTLLPIASAALLVWSVLVLVSGGLQWRLGGVILRSRDPVRPLFAALACLAAFAILNRAAFLQSIEAAVGWVRRCAPALACLCALTIAVHAIRFGYFAASGSDAYGYVSQAYEWLSGSLPHAKPIPVTFPWPSTDASLAPLGYRPGPQPHTIVPTYAPGLPLLMAAAAAVAGACGPFLVVPLCGALAVWLTFVLGRRLGGPAVGLVAAVLAATSPIVIFQVRWPMSDVPAGMLWTGALIAALGSRRRDAYICGVLTASGLLVRPNLTLAPLVLLAALAVSSRPGDRWRRSAAFLIPVAAAVAFVAWLNVLWYGGPANTGYGSPREIYSLDSVGPNLARYPVWLWRSQSAVALLALVPLSVRRAVPRRVVWSITALFGAVLFSYLIYFTFDEWWYLRFLLPAWFGFLVLEAGGMVMVARRCPRPWSYLCVALLVSISVVMTTRFNNAMPPPETARAAESRYADIGQYVRQALPAEAIIFAVQESGSLRYYGGRETIRWDLVDAEWRSRAAAEVARLGFHPYLVLEDFEEPQLRESFRIAPGVPLPWALAGRLLAIGGGVSIYDMTAAPGTLVPAALTPGTAPRCERPQPIVLRPSAGRGLPR